MRIDSLFRPYRLALLLSLGSLPAFAAPKMVPACQSSLDNEATRRELAESLGLEYVVKREGGIRRVATPRIVEKQVQKKGGARGEKVAKEVVVYDLQYFRPNGDPISDADTLTYLNSLGVPGEFSDVWYSANFDAHVLASGLDTKGRIQSTYHPAWLEARKELKFEKIREFGTAIAGGRPKIHADLHSEGVTKEKLLAAVASILETGSIRVGSRKYAEENGTYGLTTLLHDHVAVNGSKVRFKFVGKKSVEHEFTLDLPEIAPLIQNRLGTPGPAVFHYVDAKGVPRTLTGQDVKKYMIATFGGNFTAKNFRTWKATTTAAKSLLDFGPARSAVEIEENLRVAIQNAADQLRNEPSTCRDNYIFPKVLEIYRDPAAFERLLKVVGTQKLPPGVRREEAFVLELMR